MVPLIDIAVATMAEPMRMSPEQVLERGTIRELRLFAALFEMPDVQSLPSEEELTAQLGALFHPQGEDQGEG